MEIFLWLLVIGFFVLSFIGLVYPVLPSVFAVWIGFFIYHFFINSQALSGFFWISMIILTVIVLLANLLANSLAVRKFGGSKKGERVAVVSVILGSFITPPYGIIWVPFLAVFLTESFEQEGFEAALKSSTATIIGFLSGQLAEGIIQFIMIVWFFITILF